MTQRNYGGSYTKSNIDPMALLCPLVNPQSFADRFATFFSNEIMKICQLFSSSESCNTVHPPFDPPKQSLLKMKLEK